MPIQQQVLPEEGFLCFGPQQQLQVKFNLGTRSKKFAGARNDPAAPRGQHGARAAPLGPPGLCQLPSPPSIEQVLDSPSLHSLQPLSFQGPCLKHSPSQTSAVGPHSPPCSSSSGCNHTQQKKLVPSCLGPLPGHPRAGEVAPAQGNLSLSATAAT